MSKVIFGLFFFLIIAFKPAYALLEFNDNFSSGNFDKWELINGEWSYWAVNNQAAYATINKSRKLSTLVPKDEYWQEMKEYSVDFVFKVFNGTDKNFVVGMRDSSNFYDFHFYNNTLIVEDIRNGFSLHKKIIPLTLVLNRDYQLHINFSIEGIELFIDGENIFSTDESWQAPVYGGKFGLKISTGSVAYSAAYFDEIVVKEIDSSKVFFKQNDQAWADLTYDHANIWSDDPTIERFGCALASAAMLLRSHGFHYLPDGKIINPASLNDWLITQSDGYIADGLLNWLALSRLSSLLSEKSGGDLPKLEFEYFKGADLINRLDSLRLYLDGGNSQIGASDGHFFLISEYLSLENDFRIKDPLYEDEFLSSKVTELESLRLFVPSQTDLSYFLLVLPKEIEVSLLGAFTEPLEDFQFVEEKISLSDLEIGIDYKLWYYKKPESGQYNLLLAALNFEPSNLEKVHLFFYDVSGVVSEFKINDLFNEDDITQGKQLSLEINYDKAGLTTIEGKILEENPDDLLQEDLNSRQAKANQDFDDGNLSFYLFYQLTLLIESIRNNLTYFFLLERFESFHGL